LSIILTKIFNPIFLSFPQDLAHGVHDERGSSNGRGDGNNFAEEQRCNCDRRDPVGRKTSDAFSLTLTLSRREREQQLLVSIEFERGLANTVV